MPRRYPSGGSYRGQYNYQQQQQPSAVGQYQSFFDPIPIEFLQEELGKRQTRYDTAFAGTIGAKEAMAQQQAALQDLGSKNEIIGNTMGNIDKIVEEKYGGDWGRASKEVARMVSSARQNPFWETTKHLSEQQELQQKYQLDNPDAHIYQDVLGQASIDPKTGKVRGREALTFRGGKKGDWQGSVEKQYADVRADVVDAELEKARGVEGMLSKERTEEIKDTTLQNLARDGADAFIENNPDFYKSKKEIEGLSDEQIRAEAEGFIYDNIRDKAYKSTTAQVMQDKGYWERFKARAAAGTAASGIVLSGSGEHVQVAIDDPQKSRKDRKHAKAEIDKMNDGAEKTKLLKQYDRDGKALEFVIHNTQNSQHAVNLDPYYEQYVENIGDKALSRDEFENNIDDALRDGELPEVQDIETDIAPSLWGSNAGITFSNEARQAGRDIRKAMRKFHNGEGKIAMNVNILTGEMGTKDQDTYVGRLNNVATKQWTNSSTGFTLPYSNRQIGDILENDKRYNGKKRNTLPRDPKKDVVSMTDGFLQGKPIYQLLIKDKNGKELGAEYISPNDTESLIGNMQNAGVEMVRSNDPQKQQVGQRILVNSVYSPAIQKANIYNEVEGQLVGVKHDNFDVGFEQTGEGTFNLYTIIRDKSGNEVSRDYYKDENDVKYDPVDEAGIKEVLIEGEKL